MNLTTIIILFFAIGSIYVPKVVAQPNNINSTNSTGINWLQIIASGVTAAAVSSVISAIINYKITLKKITIDHMNAMVQIKETHQNTLNQLAKQQQIDSIRDKVQVYSFFIFNLDRMIRNPDFHKNTEDINKLIQTVEDIDNQVKDKYYVLNPEVAIQWLSSRHELKKPGSFYSKQMVQQVIRLRNDLAGEYNSHINPQYTQITGIDIDKIKPEKLPENMEELENILKLNNKN